MLSLNKQHALLIKRGLLALGAASLILGFALALRPAPVQVDTAAVARGPLIVTVDEEGKTRVKDIFLVSAPIAGLVRRAPLEVGDEVVKGETTVALIAPPSPTFLDVRTLSEIEAAIKASEANIDLSAAELEQAKADFNFADAEYQRTSALVSKGVVPERQLEKARADRDMREAARVRAEAALIMSRRQLEATRARAASPDQQAPRDASTARLLEVKAPETGRVLKLRVESEQEVTMGTPLMELGNTGELELVVELLSEDAVKVEAGANAVVDGWGGPPLQARVRRIDPAAFTKISALGIEEQRVNTVLDLVDPPKEWQRLGHDFRVYVRITVYENPGTLRVPLSALFRQGPEWKVFVSNGGRAQVRDVCIGERNSSFAELECGLAEGERIILHPSDRVADGVRVEERKALP